MNYIYCYENKINHHRYIGQTNNLKVRYSAHKSQSYNPNSKDYNSLFHQKIRQYGLNNFNFYVLEEIDSNDSDYIDFREQFWIKELNSWCRYGQGYNENNGGAQFKKNLSISDDDIIQIKNLLKNSEQDLTSIARDFNTYRECISRINKGLYAFDSTESYPLRYTREWREITQEIKQQIAEQIINTDTPLKDIAKKFQISEHLINQINNGLSNLQGDYKYPLRKTNKITQDQEELIYNLLLKGLKIKDIAEQTGVSRDTVSRRKKHYKI